MTPSEQSDTLRFPNFAVEAVYRVVKVSRELDAVRQLLAMNGTRADMIRSLYDAEAAVWKTIDLMDPTVKMIGWQNWLETEERRL